jgi:hypothetical protein
VVVVVVHTLGRHSRRSKKSRGSGFDAQKDFLSKRYAKRGMPTIKIINEKRVSAARQ